MADRPGGWSGLGGAPSERAGEHEPVDADANVGTPTLDEPNVPRGVKLSRSVVSKVMESTQPSDVKGLGIVGVMHLSSGSANDTGFSPDLASTKIDIGEGSSVGSRSSRPTEAVSDSPRPAVSSVAPKTISATDPRLTQATATIHPETLSPVDRLAQEQADLAPANRLALEQADLKPAFARLVSEGHSLVEAIELLGIDMQTARTLYGAPDFQQLVKAALPRVEDVRDVLMASAMPAARQLVTLMRSARSEEERGRSARDLLDRVGVSAVKQVAVAHFSAGDSKLKLVEETLREIRGEVVGRGGA